MTIKFLKKFITILIDLRFAITILILIAIASSIGSIIEQEENLEFYQNNYSLQKPIYGFITWKFIYLLGLDHIYTTWWFLCLLILLGLSLISCSISRQLPLLNNSKEYLFKKQIKSFLKLPFSIRFKNIYFLKENILLKLQKLNFYIYQQNNLIYAYQGLIGRISPILVHISLIIILLGSSWGAFNTLKAQEMLAKGEIFHIQNPIKIGNLTTIPNITTRINDFWVEYENNRVHQFYSNLSILNNSGNEIKQQTISVNNPLHYKNIDFYQSDWNLLGIRVKNLNNNQIYEVPIFSLNDKSKSWVTWIVNSENVIQTLIIDQLQNTCVIYDVNGNFKQIISVSDNIFSDLKLIEIIPATGLQIKYDPSIFLIYSGFGLLIITAFLSYLPYNQIWLFTNKQNTWIGSITNRGKIKLEIDFENLIRSIENNLSKNTFI